MPILAVTKYLLRDVLSHCKNAILNYKKFVEHGKSRFCVRAGFSKDGDSPCGHAYIVGRPFQKR